jgi:uncharacterized protein (DUF58 family)
MSDGDSGGGASAGSGADGAENGDGDESDSATIEQVGERTTNRWTGLSGGVLVAAAAGALSRTPTLFLLAAFGTALLVYARIATPPAATLAVERRLEPADPGVGEAATVELTVRNEGGRTMPDLRIADGVPPTARVVDGSPRAGVALRPGASRTLVYEVGASTGRHRFEPATVALRDVAGLVERRVRVQPDQASVTWTGDLPAADLPVEPQTGYPGRTPADDGGAGVAFHSVREHRPGDPLGRVDWNRLARTGEFATVQYRRREAAAVVLVVDTRYEAALAPSETADTAIERSVGAARALFDGLHDAGHQVGLAALPATDCWVPPGHGRTHRDRTRRRLAEDPAFAGTGSQGGRPGAPGERLLAELSTTTHVVFLSPLCDEASGRLARRLAARGNPTTVVSPDPTVAETPGQRLVAVERRERLSRLREAGVAVYDWAPGESLASLLDARREVRA